MTTKISGADAGRKLVSAPALVAAYFEPDRNEYMRARRNKTPMDSGFGRAMEWRSINDKCARRAKSSGNLAILTGPRSGHFTIDVDPKNGGDEAMAKLVAEHGPFPATNKVVTPSGGYHLNYSTDGLGFEVRNDSAGKVLGPGVDIKGHGGYRIAPGSAREDGGTYYECEESPTAYMPAPAWLVDLLRKRGKAMKARETRKLASEAKAKRARSVAAEAAKLASESHPDACCEAVASKALRAIGRELDRLAALPDGERITVRGKEHGWDSGTFVLAARLADVARWPHSAVTLDEAQALFFAHAPQAEGTYDPEHKWDDAVDRAVGVWRVGEKHRRDAHRGALVGQANAAVGAIARLNVGTVAEFTDATLVETLADLLTKMGRPIAWVPGLGWHAWTGLRWASCSDVTVTELVRLTVRAWHEAEATKFRAEGAASWKAWSEDREPRLLKLQRGGRLATLVSVLRGHVERDAAQFDSPHRGHMLNCLNGVVNLRTLELKRHDPELYITKLARVSYEPDAAHPDWKRAKAALAGATQQYFMCRLGQAITGSTPPDDKVVFCVGGGGNGKSTLMAPPIKALGDYAGVVPDKLLLAKPGDHPTELMFLRGLRLALLEELPEEGRLNGPRMKTIAGTSTITARGMRQDFTSFEPTHTLFVNTNHRPDLPGTDHGTWRRTEEIPFKRRYRKEAGDAEVDTTLRQRIEHDPAVWRAALADMVREAHAYYERGELMPDAPDEVVAANAAWRAEADDLMAYFADRLIVDPECAVRSRDLHGDFSVWLKQRDRIPWGDKLFVSRLANHEGLPIRLQQGRRKTYHDEWGRKATVKNAVWCWLGVRLRRPDESGE